ncbi:Uma2 family endonuclease [soil metagenome]
MATTTPPPRETLADLLQRLGNIPPSRVRLRPAPGTATEADLLRILDRENITCELVDGVLVEKTMGYQESEIAFLIGTLLNNYILPRRLGIVLGPDGTLRMISGQVCAPDVTFIPFDHLPGGKRPREPIPDLAPDLAVEVLSKGNTKGEMARKLREYFESGTRLVWMVDPKSKTVRVYHGPTPKPSAVLTEDQTLDGGDVLPGFSVLVRDLFPVDEI